MNFARFTIILFAVGIIFSGFSQENFTPHWEINSSTSTIWELENDHNLPHTDNIEMAGKRVAGIVTYTIDSNKNLSLEREVFFPQFHPFIKENDPDWFIYRAYLKKTFDDSSLPKLFIGEKEFVPGPVKKVSIDGVLGFEHETSQSGLSLHRILFPSMEKSLFVEHWMLFNDTDSVLEITAANAFSFEEDFGEKGKFAIHSRSEAPEKKLLKPKMPLIFQVKYQAKLNEEEFPKTIVTQNLDSRMNFLEKIKGSLNLETPDSVLNTLFEFSKIRASESIFESELGLIHSPGGGRYYAGIWANDQAEYISPFFPFLGYKEGNETAMNTFRAFKKEINPEYKNLRYAFEIEGLVPPFDLDRGDAAMIAYGAAQFALANGVKKDAEELWPLIEWCLEYNKRQLNEAGVVKSQSDEMEGRIETGTANLSTSSLYYGALLHAADLAEALGKKSKVAANYRQDAEVLHLAIESYFGDTVEGLDTYKYYEKHTYLRHWICLPLVVGINDRKEATTQALFERLWSPNGVQVEKNSDNEAITKIFWDRGTLYALRGTFLAGATDTSLEKLREFSQKRLLGERVPYVVEAYPEGNMAHLSAESGLYCRVFTEGLFGIRPTGLNSFSCSPKLPTDWDEMALRNIKAFGLHFDIEVERSQDEHLIKIINVSSGKVLQESKTDLSKPIHFTF